MESLSTTLTAYAKVLNETDLQQGYRALFNYMKDLRNHFKVNYPEYELSANLYPGYLDITFFTVTTKSAKKKQLKYAIVFKHDKTRFEVWLSGRNRDVMSEYHMKFSVLALKNYSLSADEKGMSSIIENILVEKPDFDDLPALTVQIEKEVKQFIHDIEENYLLDL